MKADRASSAASGCLMVLLVLAGFGCIVYGGWLIWPPIGYVLGGVALIITAQAVRIAAKPGAPPA